MTGQQLDRREPMAFLAEQSRAAHCAGLTVHIGPTVCCTLLHILWYICPSVTVHISPTVATAPTYIWHLVKQCQPAEESTGLIWWRLALCLHWITEFSCLVIKRSYTGCIVYTLYCVSHCIVGQSSQLVVFAVEAVGTYCIFPSGLPCTVYITLYIPLYIPQWFTEWFVLQWVGQCQGRPTPHFTAVPLPPRVVGSIAPFNRTWVFSTEACKKYLPLQEESTCTFSHVKFKPLLWRATILRVGFVPGRWWAKLSPLFCPLSSLFWIGFDVNPARAGARYPVNWAPGPLRTKSFITWTLLSLLSGI